MKKGWWIANGSSAVRLLAKARMMKATKRVIAILKSRSPISEQWSAIELIADAVDDGDWCASRRYAPHGQMFAYAVREP